MITEKFLKEKSDEDLIALMNSFADRMESIKDECLKLEKEFIQKQTDYGKIALYLNQKFEKIKD